jgi:hypothetical protein
MISPAMTSSWRKTSLALCLAACALSGCVFPGSDTPIESWEMLGITESGALIDVQATLGPTGMLHGQGHLRLDHLPPETTPIRHARHVLSPVRKGDLIHFGADSLRREQIEGGELWELSVRSEDVRGTLQAGDGRIQGWVESMQRGGLVDAHGVMLHHVRPWAPSTPREAVFVLHRRVSIGMDSAASRDSWWARLDGIALDTTDMRLLPIEGGWRLDTRPAADIVVDLRPTGVWNQRDPHGHLWGIERAILRLWGARRLRALAGLRAEVHGAGATADPPIIGQGLRLTVGRD